MNNKLAFKHKNSMALNEHKMISRENERSTSVRLCSRSLGMSFFYIIMCCTFIGFWFIMCPLIFALCNSSSVLYHWPKYWPVLFWIVALIVWILITSFFMYIWKYIKNKYYGNIKRRSYGSDETDSHKHLISKNIRSMVDVDKNNDKTIIDINSSLVDKKDLDKKNVNDSKVIGGVIRKNSKRKSDLPPLVIHRRSRNNTDNTSPNTIEQNDDNELTMDNIGETDVDKNSIKDYLKLVTVTPFEEDKNNVSSPKSPKSPKSPMSPRDLFFIDLIREAEKAEKNKENNEEKDLSKDHSRFFPENFIPSTIDHSVNSKPNNTDDEKDNKKDDKDNKKSVQNEQKYFIAEIGSPKCEITEVFIELDESDSKKKSLDVCTVKMNENNSGPPVLEIKSIEKDDA
ncbi:uncharacterized protein PFB0145c-like [Polistes fuscatus]|uniref:uncharacterized protein PFB0145c-like n=1 Tax=Polistes fuscatus TaxID=30207 RepID=UPI001CA9704C|nr:uncharacterized protein PFB0145c-like [Polistes fuscatus]